MAAHLGVLLDRPVFGVAKSRLIGRHAEPDDYPGAVEPLMAGDQQIGAVVRTKTGVKPVFVSVGHRITLAECIEYTLACVTRYRIPEPTRQAHLLSRHGY